MKNAKLLSKAEMKNVLGGNAPVGGVGTCTVSFTCGSSGSISCSSDKGVCKRGPSSDTENAWVQCDDDPKTYC